MIINTPDTDIRWIFRAGAKGGFTEVQRLDSEIAFSFRDLTDLSRLPDTRGAFRNVVGAAYPDLRASQLPLRISQIYWFVHRITPGDKVLHVDELSEVAHEGTVGGDYRYESDGDPYFNRRPIAWTAARRFRELPPELVEFWRGKTGIIPVGGISRLE
ncbi:MAG: hypothetical protein IPP47_11705 [Bryobacterales bacterium]|nr:hypothetical protein [Bryobacterales bacterium]